MLKCCVIKHPVVSCLQIQWFPAYKCWTGVHPCQKISSGFMLRQKLFSCLQMLRGCGPLSAWNHWVISTNVERLFKSILTGCQHIHYSTHFASTQFKNMHFWYHVKGAIKPCQSIFGSLPKLSKLAILQAPIKSIYFGNYVSSNHISSVNVFLRTITLTAEAIW